MGTALFTAVTGLQSFQRRLDVIANNVANVNTVGFRGSRVLFGDLFSQTLEGASAPDGTFGGTNPSQVGLGVGIATIDVDHSQGSLTTTGFASDLAIQGAGMFILNDGAANTFTRDGSFSLNANGFLIDPATGLFVQGFGLDAAGNIDIQGEVGNLQIPLGGAAIVQATTLTSLIGNLSADATIGDPLAVPPIPPDTVTRTIRVFDSLGTAREIQLTFTKIAQVDDGGTLFNAWEWDATFDGVSVVNFGMAGGTRPVLLFNPDGSLAQAGFDDGAGTLVGTLAPGVFNISIAAFPGDSIPETPFEFNIAFSDVTSLSGLSELTNPTQDGFPLGVLEDFNIGENGIINGVFSNGLTRVLGQVALATFSNVAGLERVGSNRFRVSSSSGMAQIGQSNTGGRGSISGGVLEGSNVDLGTEFSNMIVTQRGFQANARTITTADTLLGEAVNLIR
ncbi:MAG: flagellar hook protein FlgE [Candidatus Hydrogenedentes bacterium]|nr:flagellar hook protein FlgE [Candidatus Hydrogenedentota bacterium]